MLARSSPSCLARHSAERLAASSRRGFAQDLVFAVFVAVVDGTALAGLAAAAGAALVAWHALGAMWVLVCACTHRTLNLRHSAPLVRKLATGAAIIALSCAPASANDDNLGWGAHGPSPSATASASASARPSASAKASAPATASSPSKSPHASSAPTSRASASPTSHASARARASASASASPRPSARPSASPSRSSAHPRSGGPGSKTPAVKSPGAKAPGAKSPNSKASPKSGSLKSSVPKSGSLKPGSAQRSGTCVPAPDAKPAPVIRQHLVLAGESLWSISLQWLQQNGVPSPTNGQVAQLSKQIFAANAALIGANPDLIRPGLALTIPTRG